MKMLCREFFPGADIRQDPCDCNLIWKDGVWTLTEKNGRILRRRPLAGQMHLETSAEIWRRTGKRSVLYSLLEGANGKGNPWGILTGVRPTKMVYEGLEHGPCSGRNQKDIRNRILASKRQGEFGSGSGSAGKRTFYRIIEVRIWICMWGYLSVHPAVPTAPLFLMIFIHWGM